MDYNIKGKSWLRKNIIGDYMQKRSHADPRAQIQNFYEYNQLR